MTISTTNNQITYVGDAVTLAFAFPYPFIATTDLKVYVNGAQVLTGFSVAGTIPFGGSGTFATGTVTFVAAPAAAATILIYSDPDQLQSTSLPPNDPFPSKTVEKMVDKVTLLIQAIYRKFGNALTYPTGDLANGVLPTVANRASKLVSFDASGNVIAVAPSAGSATALAIQLADTASASNGDALIGVLQPFTGTVATTQHELNSRVVYAFDFMSVAQRADVLSTGSLDVAAAILAAATALGSAGGTVVIDKSMRCLIDNNITIPPNVCLRGPHGFVGSPGTNASAPYGNLGGVLIINSTKTITLGSGSSVIGLLVYRKGMTFPAATPAAFAGTAFTAGGDDVAMSNSMVLGFNLAYFSNGFQRPRLQNLYLDNNNGIEIMACADTAYLHTIHQWPFASIAGGAATLAKDTRSGTAINLHDLVDWGKVTDCFSWGYFRSIIVNNANSVTLTGCGADNFYSGGPGYANSIGFLIQGTSTETRLVNCQAAAQATAGINVNTSADLLTQISGFNVWGGSSHGILVSAGDVQVKGGGFRDVGRQVSTTNAASRIFVDDTRSRGITSSAFLSTVSTSNFFIGPNIDYGDLAAGTAAITANLVANSYASAATINLAPSDQVVAITGTTGISAIKAGWRDRRVTLVFAGVLTLTHSTANTDSVRLSGAVNFATTAGGTLTIVHNGTQWFEVGRSA